MHPLQTSMACLLLCVGASSQADDIRPGLWKISLEARVSALSDWTPEPFEVTQCLTGEDARHPDRLLAGMGGSGVTGCDFSNREYTGGHIRFDVACAGQLGLIGHGEMDLSATRLDGTLDVNFADAALGGQKTAMQNTLHAVYLGECKAAGAGGNTPTPAAMGAPATHPAAPPAK